MSKSTVKEMKVLKNSAGIAEYPYMVVVRTCNFTIPNNRLRVDHRPKFKSWNYKTLRTKYRNNFSWPWVR